MPETRNTVEAVPGALLRLQFNGATVSLAANTTLAALLDQEGIAPASVATAVNGEFVPRPVRAQHRLHNGDAVLTFQAIVGG